MLPSARRTIQLVRTSLVIALAYLLGVQALTAGLAGSSAVAAAGDPAGATLCVPGAEQASDNQAPGDGACDHSACGVACGGAGVPILPAARIVQAVRFPIAPERATVPQFLSGSPHPAGPFLARGPPAAA
jgi:hypothetical protein